MVPEIVTALEKSSALTSGLIDRSMIPSLRTVGRNRNSTPKSLNSMVGVATPIPEVTAMGTGIWPPAWKLAVWPESATRFGSASLCSRPLVSSAVMSVSIFTPLLTISARTEPNGAPTFAPTNVAAV